MIKSDDHFPRITDELNSLQAHFGDIKGLITMDSQIHEDLAYNDPVQEKVVEEVKEEVKEQKEDEEEVAPAEEEEGEK